MIPAGTEIAYTVTFLEMTEVPGAPAPLPAGAQAVHAKSPPVWYFLALYRAVGEAYEWRDMLERPEAEVAAFIADRDVELWVLMRAGVPAGFALLDFTRLGVGALRYFGLAPHAVGTGLGRPFLETAVALLWDRPGVARLTVNTCTLDHPRALGLYRRVGFRDVARRERTRVLTRDRAA